MATKFDATEISETRAYCAVVDSHDCECPPGSVVGRRPTACYACGLDVCRQCSTVIYYDSVTIPASIVQRVLGDRR